ncbi:MAG: protease pro-enzyme activation domain-containing protein [Bryobacteraceae bacterium]
MHSSTAHFTPANPDLELDVTIMLRRPSPGALAADPKDLAAVQSFVQSYGLRVVSENPDARTIKAAGTAARMHSAFGVTLEYSGTSATDQAITYQGPLSVPKALDGIIIAVLGLDHRPIAKPRS